MKTRNFLIPAAAFALTLAFVSCNKPTPLPAEPLADTKDVPNLPEEPYDYPASSNDYLAALGRVLFYEKELSANKNISCGSCHQQDHAFTDAQRFSAGTDNLHGTRNSPSIFNKMGRLFWDGRANSMTDLAFRPVRDKVEMNTQDINMLMERIASIDYYNHIFKYAFPKATKIDSNMIKNAIAEFLKNFNFSDTKFSQVKKNVANFTPSEQLGNDLFFGKAKCANCHHIDGSFTNNNNSGYGMTNESHNIGLDAENKDLGVGKFSKNVNDNGAFMMPVLLNCEFTAPYMHDGRFATLEEVVEHYNSKIQNNPSLDRILREFGTNQPIKLNLTDVEKKGLVDFLKTLSDPSILTDERFSDPFVPRSM
jgi:cytochrome c peroxidase